MIVDVDVGVLKVLLDDDDRRRSWSGRILA
jgi:hypothetical protein